MVCVYVRVCEPASKPNFSDGICQGVFRGRKVRLVLLFHRWNSVKFVLSWNKTESFILPEKMTLVVEILACVVSNT